MRPLDVPVEGTLKFVTAHLPPRRLRLLEVGCGTGEPARSLLKFGHEVVAVDESEDSVEAARRLGVAWT
jgi:2-polyprenyl-3-methyl-5-hydroxy-6-metoxy-1,4-benzoquinol methylase